MASNTTNKIPCLVNGRLHRVSGGDYLDNLDPALQAVIMRDYPQAPSHSFICNEHQVKFRLEVLDTLFHYDVQENVAVNKRLSRRLESSDYQIHDVEEQLQTQETWGEKAADKVTDFVGSWGFIVVYVGILVVWMTLNVIGAVFGWAWDRYPFILLNLFLSVTAALQAPLIMMSQNRASNFDRLSAKNDFQTNLKSEAGVSALNDKLDHLMMSDQASTLQVQKIQTEMLGDLQILLNEVYQQIQDVKDQLDDLEDTIDDIEENTEDDPDDEGGAAGGSGFRPGTADWARVRTGVSNAGAILRERAAAGQGRRPHEHEHHHDEQNPQKIMEDIMGDDPVATSDPTPAAPATPSPAATA